MLRSNAREQYRKLQLSKRAPEDIEREWGPIARPLPPERQ